MALFPPLEFGPPLTAYSSLPKGKRTRDHLLFDPNTGAGSSADLRGGRSRSSRRSGRNALFGDSLLPDVLAVSLPLSSHFGRSLDGAKCRFQQPMSGEPKKTKAQLGDNATGGALIQSFPLKDLNLGLKSPFLHDNTTSALPNSLDELRKNRIEFTAELFIILTTTRKDCLSLETTILPSNTDPLLHEETLYTFQCTSVPIPNRSSSLYGGDTFSTMYRPQASKTTSSSNFGFNSRFWRMAIASLLLRERIPYFRSALKTFNFLYELLYDLSAYGANGVKMTALASIKGLSDVAQGNASFTDAKESGGSGGLGREAMLLKAKINHLDGMEEDYERKLLVYMAQVGMNYLSSESTVNLKARTTTLNKKPNRMFLEGLLETSPTSFSTSSTSVVRETEIKMARELEETRYFLHCVDQGVYEPNLRKLKEQILPLPRPIPRKAKDRKESNSALKDDPLFL